MVPVIAIGGTIKKWSVTELTADPKALESFVSDLAAPGFEYALPERHEGRGTYPGSGEENHQKGRNRGLIVTGNNVILLNYGRHYMAMSSAERQARFRERRKAQGLKRRDAWQDAAGFLPAEGEEAETRPRADYRDFIRELKELVKPIPKPEAEEIYAELLRRARLLREGWDRIDAEIRGIVDREKERGEW